LLIVSILSIREDVHCRDWIYHVRPPTKHCAWLILLELTETAFANSCCSVFHSSVVKVPAQHADHTAISLN
jgi:hypothetical protein